MNSEGANGRSRVLKPITLQLMCPGVWPLEGDSLVYEVQSDHDPDVRYKVDKTAYWGFGKCSCLDFTMRHEPFLRDGATPSNRHRCKHIRRVDFFLAIEVAQAIIATRESGADKNSKENGRNPQKYDAEAPAF